MGKPGEQKETTVGSFEIGVYEVTQGQWKTVRGNNPASFKSDPDSDP